MIESVKRINGQPSVMLGQPTPEQLRQAAREGFMSVINLRSPDEEGTLSDEGQHAGAAGLNYVHMPVKPEALSDGLADQVLQQIDQAPKPVLVHCKTGLRSGAMALMYAAIQEGLSVAEAMEKGRQLGFSCGAVPRMKQFFEHYVSTHSKGSG